VINRFPLLSRFFLLVLLPLLALLGYAWHHLAASITPSAGELKVAGLQQPVQISEDAYGTPRIVANTDRDAYFALGFKHASDRLWQLELQRRLAQGRLSEVLGAGALGEDIWMRSLGLHEAARKALAHLDKDTLAGLNAYAEGINAWVAQAPSLPPEFQLLGIKPEPWTAYDSVSWQKVFSLTLSGNIFDEVRRSALLQKLPPEQLKYFYPYDPVSALAVAQKDTNTPTSELLARSDSLLQWGIGHPFTGSNAWVVSGKYTQSGKPLLANDPHVGLQMPSIWYAAALKGDKLDVSGMTLVGLPMVIFGQNAQIAWGGTSLESDQQDLFIETLSPAHPDQYLDNGQWRAFETRTEVIKVSPDFPALLNEKLNPVELKVRRTSRGPVISDVRTMMDQVLSLRWSALDDDDRTTDAFFQLQYASDWASFRQSLSLLKSPGLNFVYADRAGNIGYQAAGMLPKRGRGRAVEGQVASQSAGLIPLIAAAGADWQGYFPFEAMPSRYNPSEGFIVSANQQLPSELLPDPALVISHEWAPMARHDRISKLLQTHIASGALFSLEQMGQIQGDRTDLSALALLPLLQNHKTSDAQSAAAVAALANWQGEFSGDSVAATLFTTWTYYLKQELFGSLQDVGWQRPGKENLLGSAVDRMDWFRLSDALASGDWCKPVQANPCAGELQRSLDSALRQLKKITGTDDLQQWRWGELIITEFIHQPFGRMKGLGLAFNRTLNTAASPNSINAANLQFDPLRGFRQDFGASFRQVFELDERRSHHYLLSTGQSGNVMSTHFDDMLHGFSQNRLAPFAGDLYMKNTSSAPLILVPAHSPAAAVAGVAQ
jgi:penicillin G amidase